jgi:hypothetical protein
VTTNPGNPIMPLTEKDREALDDIFETIALEDIKDIETTVARYAAAPIEAWEEAGWVVNSFLPNPS